MIPVPTVRFLKLLILPLIFFLPGIWVPVLFYPGLILDAALFFLLILDWLLLPQGEDLNPRLEGRSFFSIGRDNRLEVCLTNPSGRPLRVEVKCAVPDFFEDHSAAGPYIILPGKTITPGVLLCPFRRGVFSVDRIHLRYASPLGLVTVNPRIRVNREITVLPDVTELSTYLTMARKNRLADIGIHRNPYRGMGSELESLRDYQQDDDAGKIDWKVTTRVNRPVTRVLEMESSNNVTIILDCGRLMTAEQGGLATLDLAVNSILILAHIIFRMGDQLNIIAFSDRIIGHLPAVKGKASIKKVTHFLSRLQPEFVEPDYKLAFEYIRRTRKKRSILIFFTDMMDDINYEFYRKYLTLLNRKHISLFILLRDTTLKEYSEMEARDSETLYLTAAAREMFLRRREAVIKLRLNRINVLDILPGELTPRLVDKYFEIKARKI